MFNLVLGSGAKAQSCNGRFTVEKVFATRIGHKIGRNTRSLGFFFCTKKVMKVFGSKTDLGAGVSGKLIMVFFLEGRLGSDECTEIGVASLTTLLACVHAKV